MHALGIGLAAEEEANGIRVSNLYPGEVDLGWRLIQLFEGLGLAWDIVTPERLPHRAALRRVRRSRPPGCPIAAS